MVTLVALLLLVAVAFWLLQFIAKVASETANASSKAVTGTFAAMFGAKRQASLIVPPELDAKIHGIPGTMQ